MNRLLFFCRKNTMCERFYLAYVAKFKKWTKVIDLTIPDQEKLDFAKVYKVTTVPSLILLHQDGTTPMISWRGGQPPNLNYINVEIGMVNAYGPQGPEDQT